MTTTLPFRPWSRQLTVKDCVEIAALVCASRPPLQLPPRFQASANEAAQAK